MVAYVAYVAYVAFLSLQYPFYWNAGINGVALEILQMQFQLRTYLSDDIESRICEAQDRSEYPFGKNDIDRTYRKALGRVAHGQIHN